MLPTKISDWNDALALPWADAYAFVEARVKYLFDTLSNPRVFSTSELVEFLYPANLARGESLTRRKRLFKALAALAKHQLAAYCEPGPKRRLRHGTREITPLVWRTPLVAPAEPARCPHCGGLL